MAWTPDQPWPSDTPGGAAAEGWGGYIRFWLLAEIAAGTPFTMGPDPNDRLDAGNVFWSVALLRFSPATPDPADMPAPAALPGTAALWVDMTCDLIDCQIANGVSSAAGILSKSEAGTLSASLYDPTGKYDPLNPSTVFALGARSRLVPGVRILAFCEIVADPAATPPTVRQVALFNGTADRWAQDWTKWPGERVAELTATDFVKRLVKLDREEQPPAGQGDPVHDRLLRIANYYGFMTPARWGPPSNRTLQATTLAQSAWELMNRVIDDELGFIFVNPTVYPDVGNGLVWLARESWTDQTVGPTIFVGCGGPGFFDIVSDATPAAFDADMVNTVAASRSGGTTQTASVPRSVQLWGEMSAQRSDLGLADDTQVQAWAQTVVNMQAWPRQAIENVTLHPAVAPDSWAAWDACVMPFLVQTIARVVFESDLFDYTVDIPARVVGYKHSIGPYEWVIEWVTVAANIGMAPNTWTLGPHANDRMDAGFVLG